MQQIYHNLSASVTLGSAFEGNIMEEPLTLNLIYKLCKTLEVESVVYCHWKSNVTLDRSASGDNDLDHLVSRPDVQLFTDILYRLGLKEARASTEKQLPGVFSYLANGHPHDLTRDFGSSGR